MAEAIIALVAQIERENRLAGYAACNGIYRLKYQGHQVEMSFERFHGCLPQTPKQHYN